MNRRLGARLKYWVYRGIEQYPSINSGQGTYLLGVINKKLDSQQ